MRLGDLLWALPAIVVAMIVYLNLRNARGGSRRAKRLGAIAQRHGWLYSDTDVFGLGVYDFELFRRGNSRRFENTIWGHHKETPFQFADYWYAVEYDSENLPFAVRHSRKRFSLVIVRLNAYLPRLRVEPESLGKWMADPSDKLDIHFESDEFNRRFRTETGDRLYAYKLIAPSMMQWLLAMPPGFGVEFYKSAFMVFAPLIDPSEVFAMVAGAIGIRQRIPKMVWDEYAVTQEDAERHWA